MKCTPIKLLCRSELPRRKTDKIIPRTEDPGFTTQECSWYSCSFSRHPYASENNDRHVNVSVKNLDLPENVRSYNSGSSLNKWSNKRPRLKSAKNKQKLLDNDVRDEDNTYDIDNIISSLSTNEDSSKDEPEYELNSDIEELIKKSKQREGHEKFTKEKRRKPKCSKKKLKRKLKKTIRFSFSKPVSPETEQVIRVDVTSNLSFEELKQLQISEGDCSNSSSKASDDAKKEIHIVLQNNKLPGLENDEQECIVRCSQLALAPKR